MTLKRSENPGPIGFTPRSKRIGLIFSADEPTPTPAAPTFDPSRLVVMPEISSDGRLQQSVDADHWRMKVLEL
jgi:hypothetical protein